MKKYLLILIFLISCGGPKEPDVHIFNDNMEIVSIQRVSDMSFAINRPTQYKYVLKLDAEGFESYFYTNDNSFKIGDSLKIIKK